jgi:molybdopterin-guanine dinucleotide biosynthesis protein A
VVVAAADQPLPLLPGSTIVVRDSAPGRGPLQGLADGFAALPHGVELAYATAVDAPLLEPAWIERLAREIVGHDLALPCTGSLRHPLSALYRVSPALVAIRELLGRDVLRVGQLEHSLRTRVVDAEALRDVDPGLRTLRNLNTPEDYQRALRDAGST